MGPIYSRGKERFEGKVFEFPDFRFTMDVFEFYSPCVGSIPGDGILPFWGSKCSRQLSAICGGRTRRYQR